MKRILQYMKDKYRYKKAGVTMPSLFNYQDSITLRDWIRGKLSEEDCSIKPTDLIHPDPLVRENAKSLYGQPNDYLRGRLQKAVNKLNRRWTNSTGPG